MKQLEDRLKSTFPAILYNNPNSEKRSLPASTQPADRSEIPREGEYEKLK